MRSSRHASRAIVAALRASAALLLLAAAIHLWVVPEHLEEWWGYGAFFLVVAIAQVLPISVGGLGLREGALVLLLAPLGVGAAKATALGLLLYGINLVVSLFGAPSFAMWSRNPRVMALAE